MPQMTAHQNVWRIAGPLIISNLTVPLLGIVDTAVVGHLDEAYHVGAVAIGAVIFGVVFWGFGFLRMGTTGITAQAYGKGDHQELRATLCRALLLAIGFSLLILVLQVPIASLAFYWLDGSELVEQQANVYYDIRVFSAPATLMNYALLGWFLGMQNARMPLYIMLMVNIVNMILDVIFVMLWNYGANGVAWASLIAEYTGVLFAFWLVRKELRRFPGEWPMASLRRKDKLREMISINKNIFIRNLCLMFSLAFFTAQGARFGDVVLAANAVLFHFQTLMAYGLDGFAHAAEALVGKAIGGKNRVAYYDVIKTSSFWAVIVSVGFSLVYYFAGPALISMMTDIEAVRREAMYYLPWVVFLPLVSVWSFLFDGIYIGAMRAKEMRNTMLLSTFMVFLPAWYLLLPLGNHGLWLAFMLFILARGISMAVLFNRIAVRSEFNS